jgi:DNA-binding PadR family transcriptional regulator
MKLGQLYALLGKLEAAGFVTVTSEPQPSRPPRKLFQLTEQGEAAFLSWVQCPVGHGRSLRLEFLVKLYFARLEGEGVAASLLALQRRECREWLAAEQEIANEEIAHGRRYNHLVHQFRLGQVRAMLEWLDHCAEVLAHEE